MIKNKNGFLLGEETLKIIVAILCILLLIFLAYSLYSSFTTNRFIEQAQGTLEQIADGLAVVDKEGSYETTLAQPVGYSLNSNYMDSELKPYKQDICNTKTYCLCICAGNRGITISCGEKLTVCRAFDEKIRIDANNDKANGKNTIMFQICPTDIRIEKNSDEGGYIIKDMFEARGSKGECY